VNVTRFAVVIFAFLGGLAVADEGPRTGFFRAEITPLDLLGETAAKGVADVLPPGKELEYQYYVPRNYDPAKPAGLVVWINNSGKGYTPKMWNDVLIEKNLIAIGAHGSGRRAPIAERMLKAIVAPQFAARDYKLDPARVYVVGYNDGGAVAARVEVMQPGIFKGAIYISGAVHWGDKLPPKIDQVRQNRHAFIVGNLDNNMSDIQRVQQAYERDGVANTELIVIPNHGDRWPGPSYFQRAIEFLDASAGNQSLQP
jgi:predicted esterase